MDLRERIVAAYDGREGTKEEVAKRFKVSEGMVKKLLAQRSRTGDLRPRYRFCGRKAELEPKHGEKMRKLVEKEPDVTLEEIRQRLELDCTIGAIHWVLTKMGLTYKKRRSMRPSKTGPMSPRLGGGGNAAKRRSTPPGSSSSTNRRRKRT
jgi:transposase